MRILSLETRNIKQILVACLLVCLSVLDLAAQHTLTLYIKDAGTREVLPGAGVLDWVAGLNLWTDLFEEEQRTDFPLRDYNQSVVGVFVQNVWRATDKLHLESGLRVDHVSDYGWAVLPRLSLHCRFTEKFSSRLGGGFGYKAPTLFTEDSERIQFRRVHAIDPLANKLERSYGTNIDFNYRTGLFADRVTLGINQLFFYTYLHNPLQLEADGGDFRFLSSGKTQSRGGETNVKLGYKDFHLYIGYTYTDMFTETNGTKTRNRLTPQHRLNNILMYEVEDEWKVGLEAYYFSRQRLGNGCWGNSYWVCGFMVEKIWEHISLYANFENFTDRRQTRFGTLYTGSISNPVFRDIYAPLDGFVMNAGVKLRF